MPSITPVMSAILRELALMDSMVCTTCVTACPPRVAVCEALEVRWLAWCAESALCDTVPVRSASAAALA